MENKTKWSIDQENSEITFKIGHIIISHVKGSAKIFDASIYTNEKDFGNTEVDIWIDPSSISTGDKNRDEQIRGEDFFDVKKHKQITFTSNGIENPDEEGNHELWGDLTIKGITKRVKFYITFGKIKTSANGDARIECRTTGKLNRSDWDLYGKSSFEFGGMMVSQDVKIICNIILTSGGNKDLTMILESDRSNVL
jgi:polyisoprenoid-binding protein YceI